MKILDSIRRFLARPQQPQQPYFTVVSPSAAADYRAAFGSSATVVESKLLDGEIGEMGPVVVIRE